MAYIGNTVQTQGFAPAVDYFNGDGTTVTFTLSRPVASVAQLTAVIDNVIQNPSSAFTVSGNAITFTSAPLSGTNNIWVEYTSLVTTYAAISQDPSVIGDLTASGGYLSTGDFGNSYIDGTIVDYVTGNARITTGPLDDMTFYHGGTTSRSELLSLYYAGGAKVYGTTALTIPVGTTAQRPTGASGMIRYNSTLAYPEWYDAASSSWQPFTSLSGLVVADFLVVGGGGGGGSGGSTMYTSAGGGGGAGGLRSSVTATGGGGTLESPLNLVVGTTYTITVGAGGAGASNSANGSQGGNSVFATVTSLGGGYGAYEATGGSGGSGGASSGGSAGPGSGTAGQGYAAGNAATSSGAGGGGAGAVGTTATGNGGYAGGVGVAVAITGSSVYYAGGGGGGTYSAAAGAGGAGGNGGGGAGGANQANGSAATANTGGGGGASGGTYNTTGSLSSGAGGSGVVIVRVLTSKYSGTTTGSPTVTTDGSYTVIKYTSSGTYTA